MLIRSLLCLVVCLATSLPLLAANNDDLSSRVAALQFDQAASKNSIDYQLKSQASKFEAELAGLHAEISHMRAEQQQAQKRVIGMFVFMGILLLALGAAAGLTPWYLLRRKQLGAQREQEEAQRNLRVAKELLEQMRADFKAIQGKMRAYRSEFENKLAELRLTEMSLRQPKPVAPAQPDVQAEPVVAESAVLETPRVASAAPAAQAEGVWHDEIASFRALAEAEPGVGEHHRHLADALAHGFVESADAALAEAALTHYVAAQESDPADCQAVVSAGKLLASWARRIGMEEGEAKLAEAEQYFIKAEQLKRGAAAYHLATLCAVTGRAEDARKWLVLARLAGAPQAEDLQLLKTDPDLDTLRQQSWFVSYLTSLEEELAEA